MLGTLAVRILAILRPKTPIGLTGHAMSGQPGIRPDNPGEMFVDVRLSRVVGIYIYIYIYIGLYTRNCTDICVMETRVILTREIVLTHCADLC